MTLNDVVWRKSSRSGGQGECVEVAEMFRAVAVRDSKNPHRRALTVGGPAWRSLITETKQGRYDI